MAKLTIMNTSLSAFRRVSDSVRTGCGVVAGKLQAAISSAPTKVANDKPRTAGSAKLASAVSTPKKASGTRLAALAKSPAAPAPKFQSFLKRDKMRIVTIPPKTTTAVTKKNVVASKPAPLQRSAGPGPVLGRVKDDKVMTTKKTKTTTKPPAKTKSKAAQPTKPMPAKAAGGTGAVRGRATTAKTTATKRPERKTLKAAVPSIVLSAKGKGASSGRGVKGVKDARRVKKVEEVKKEEVKKVDMLTEVRELRDRGLVSLEVTGGRKGVYRVEVPVLTKGYYCWVDQVDRKLKRYVPKNSAAYHRVLEGCKYESALPMLRKGEAKFRNLAEPVYWEWLPDNWSDFFTRTLQPSATLAPPAKSCRVKKGAAAVKSVRFAKSVRFVEEPEVMEYAPLVWNPTRFGPDYYEPSGHSIFTLYDEEDCKLQALTEVFMTRYQAVHGYRARNRSEDAFRLLNGQKPWVDAGHDVYGNRLHKLSLNLRLPFTVNPWDIAMLLDQSMYRMPMPDIWAAGTGQFQLEPGFDWMKVVFYRPVVVDELAWCQGALENKRRKENEARGIEW